MGKVREFLDYIREVIRSFSTTKIIVYPFGHGVFVNGKPVDKTWQWILLTLIAHIVSILGGLIFFICWPVDEALKLVGRRGFFDSAIEEISLNPNWIKRK